MVYLNFHTGWLAWYRIMDERDPSDVKIIAAADKLSGIRTFKMDVPHLPTGTTCTIIAEKFLSQDERRELFLDLQNTENWLKVDNEHYNTQ